MLEQALIEKMLKRELYNIEDRRRTVLEHRRKMPGDIPFTDCELAELATLRAQFELRGA
jgi:hypothetical protein